VIIFLTIPQQQVLAPETLQPGVIGAESSRTTGASNNAPPGKTQQKRRHQLVLRDAAIVATEHMTQDPHSTIVRETGTTKHNTKHAIGCELNQINVDDSQLTMKPKAGVHRERRDKLISARNGNPPWLNTAFVHTVREIEHHKVASSWIFAD